MSVEKQIRVLYVDDEAHNLTSFKATFRRHYKVFTALNGIEALRTLHQEEIHVIITDQRMPEMTGVEFLKEVLKFNEESIRVLLTGYADIDALTSAVNEGQIYHYLKKPWDEEELHKIINEGYQIFLKNKTKEELNEKLKASYEEIERLKKNKPS